MSLAIRLRHRFPGTELDMAFEVATPGVSVLFGPSGAGKSSLIAAAAGLFRPDECRIVLDGERLADTAAGIWRPPERRRIGMVFQDARLFPHMSVATNLRFGLRRVPAEAGRAVRFDDVVALLGIGALLGRRPHTLSGGERQRVAIGRALLAQPHLLLMDEPLASLDAGRKAEFLPYLIGLKTALSLPVLYVTHALDEVNRLADSIVLIEAGRVLGCGTAEAMTGRADLPLARRDDSGALLACRVEGHDEATGLTRLDAGGVTLFVPLMAVPPGRACRVRIPAREVILAARRPEAISLHNIIACTVLRIVAAPVLVELAFPGGALLARVTPDAVSRLSLREDAPILALIKSTSIEIAAVY